MDRIKNFLKLALLNQRGEVGMMGGAAAAPAATGAPDAQPPQAAPAAPVSASAFTLDSLGEEYRGHKSLQNFIQDNTVNVGELVKSYVNAQKLIGADKMMVPNENFTDEQWKDVYKKLGLPESVDKYSVESKKIENFEMNKDFMEGIKKAAYESGVLPKQAQKLVDFMSEFVANDIKQAQLKHVEQVERGVNELKSIWGEGYQKEIQVAEQGISHFADKADLDALREAGVLDNPAVVKLFNKIGKALNSEDSFSDEGKKGFGLTPDEIREEIRSMYSPGNPFMVKTHPDHKHAVEKMLKYQEMLHGNKAATTFNLGA